MKKTLAKWMVAIAIICCFTASGCYTRRHGDRDRDHQENHDRDRDYHN